MRIPALLAVVVLAAAVLVVPEPDRPVPQPPEPQAAPSYTVCPLVESARRTTVLDLMGGGEGEATANVFAGGRIAAESAIPVPESGVAAFEVAEMTGIAVAPILVGLDNPARRVEASLTGPGLAASSCGVSSSEPQILLGGSTQEGESYTVAVSNPFAGAATVDIQVASEVGVESDSALEGVVVPPRSVVSSDLSNLLPGRQAMSTAVVTRQGRVVAGALHQSASDTSAVAPLAPAFDWYLTLPTVGASRHLVLFNPGVSDAAFQLDVYGPDGLVEAAWEEVVPSRGQFLVPDSTVLEGDGAIRVLATSPLAAALRLSGEAGNTVLPGVTTPGPSWLLPGAGRHGESRVHVFNAGDVEVTARVLSAAGEEIETVAVPANALIAVEIPAGPGVRLEADGDLVVTWTTATEEGLAGDAGQQPAGG